jgi:hypothetical protein
LVAIVEKLLAKNTANRFQSATELAELLGQHLARLQHPSLSPPSPLEFRQTTAPYARAAQAVGRTDRKRRRFGVAVGLLGLAASLPAGVILAWGTLFPTARERPGDSPGVLQTPEDPRVLTVSKRPEDGARFRTIQEALDAVQPDMTIRILDEAVYEEYLVVDRPEQQRGVVLEAVGKATLRLLPKLQKIVWIRGVSRFTLRGLQFESVQGPSSQIYLEGSCAGVVLDRLHMTATPNNVCINLNEVSLSGDDVPIVIQNCTMRTANKAVLCGQTDSDPNQPRLSGHVVIRNNTMIQCLMPVFLAGAVKRAHIVGNRMVDSVDAAVDLFDLLPGAADILVANNTSLRNRFALRLWDDNAKGKDFLKCKNVRVQNNLVLDPQWGADLIFLDHDRGAFGQDRPADVVSLLKSPEWRFSHNWRETRRPAPGGKAALLWIPPSKDHLQVPIDAGSRQLGQLNFLRPPKGSPLATGGAGTEDPALPPFVGAVPPEGVQPWDWDRTWKALSR